MEWRKRKKTRWREMISSRAIPTGDLCHPTDLSGSNEWARPSYSQVASVTGCKLPLEGMTLAGISNVLFPAVLSALNCAWHIVGTQETLLSE